MITFCFRKVSSCAWTFMELAAIHFIPLVSFWKFQTFHRSCCQDSGDESWVFILVLKALTCGLSLERYILLVSEPCCFWPPWKWQNQNCDMSFTVFSGTQVRLWSEDGLQAEVVGLDHNGFLQVYSSENGMVSLEPDGNSFDMLKNLVVIKQH